MNLDAPATRPEPRSRPKRIVVCLDGTWNNPATEQIRDNAEKVFKPTNVLKTSRAVLDLDDTTGAVVLTGVPQPGEWVTLAGETYTFQPGPVTDVGQVRIDDSAQKTLENLYVAINRIPSRGRYGAATPAHPRLRARKVAGNRRVIELVVAPDAAPDLAAGDLFAHKAHLSRGHVVDKSALAAACRTRGIDPSEGIPQVAYYDVGVGALRAYPGRSNWMHRAIDRLLGGAKGAGFEANIEAAYTFLALNHVVGDEIFVFGFSRGACAARGLCRFIDWMGGVPPARDAFWIPRYFDAFLTQETTAEAVRAEINPERAGEIVRARVRFLGVWDSVLALGRERRERPHVGDTPPAVVDHACQALAIDERRASFEPRVWRHAAPDNPDQTLIQLWFAGVHSNVGGGYVQDGLANLALAWLLDQARDAGLALDGSFLRHYRRGHHAARQYESLRGIWKLLQAVTFRSGVREIDLSPAGGLSMHGSVLHRLAATEVQHDDVDDPVRYRPKNVLRTLARLEASGDLDDFIASLDDLEEGFVLPDAVRAAIAEHR